MEFKELFFSLRCKMSQEHLIFGVYLNFSNIEFEILNKATWPSG